MKFLKLLFFFSMIVANLALTGFSVMIVFSFYLQKPELSNWAIACGIWIAMVGSHLTSKLTIKFQDLDQTG